MRLVGESFVAVWGVELGLVGVSLAFRAVPLLVSRLDHGGSAGAGTRHAWSCSAGDFIEIHKNYYNKRRPTFCSQNRSFVRAIMRKCAIGG